MSSKWIWIGVAIIAILLVGIVAGWWIAGALGGGGGVVGGVAAYVRREQKRRKEDQQIDEDTRKKKDKIDKQKDKQLADSQKEFKQDATVPTNDDDANDKLDRAAENYERSRES